uniref:Ig-like domain-containing protein n=1 Tax=Sinocyclocheilus grahami TaxID=75366 RepID=A0A672SQ95_SINGR
KCKHIILGLSSFFLFYLKIIYGEEMEMKVKPGDNITLFCDRSLTLGSVVVWIRNCSHENQPSLIIDFRKLGMEIFQRFSFIHNLYNNSYDLHITNISVSDLGLYYCAKLEIKVNEDGKGIISSSDVYYYGNQTICLSLGGKKTLLLVIITPFEVCYASVDFMTRRQNRHKKTQVPSSDITTYAPVRTETE